MFITHRTYDDGWDRRNERYMRELSRRQDWQGRLIRDAYGWPLDRNPRTSCKATKRYADGRQKKRKR